MTVSTASNPQQTYPVRGGNQVRLISDGDELFETALGAIRRASRRVWLETYIYEPDRAGDLMRSALMAAAERGCETILLLDSWGSPRINEEYAQPLREAGGKVIAYNPALPWRRLGRKFAPFFHRDHRKVLIADDVGFCGGRNISEEYGGPGTQVFYDLTLQLSGPVVEDMADAFLRPIRVSSVTELPELENLSSAASPGVDARILLGNRRLGLTELDDEIRRVLTTAERQVLLMTPYLIPPDWFLALARATSERGVDVSILTAGRSDLPLVQIAGRDLYGGLIEAGVRVYELLEPTLHAKCLAVDGSYSIVGSYNIDVHSSRHNLEIGVGVNDPELATLIEELFQGLIEQSRAIDLKQWKGRQLPGKVASWILSRLFRF